MGAANSILDSLSCAEITLMTANAIHREFKGGERIFSEGDEADYIYFIDTGRVSISIQKFHVQEELEILGPGDFFGEMAIFHNDKRTASVAALEDTSVFGVEINDFLDLMLAHREIAKKINSVLAKRSQELLIKECLLNETGLTGRNLHVSIKGDPSLRESSFSRQRYESVVDPILPELCTAMDDLLINRCVYQVFVGFNNGEIRTSSTCNPFIEEIHSATKIIDEAYRDRHFPKIPYEHKTGMIRRLYQAIKCDENFGRLPDQHKGLLSDFYDNWKPVSLTEIKNTISELPVLRQIPNFFLRNLTISMTRDAIRMQFNCDGTHIVSSDDYMRFLEENLEKSRPQGGGRRAKG